MRERQIISRFQAAYWLLFRDMLHEHVSHVRSIDSIHGIHVSVLPPFSDTEWCLSRVCDLGTAGG